MANKRAYDPLIRNELDRVDWKSVFAKVVKFARSKEIILRALGSDFNYEDLIQEAVARLYGQGFNGTYRNWNSTKYPNIGLFLTFVIKDVVRDEIRKLSTFMFQPLQNDDGFEKDFQFDQDSMDITESLKTKSIEDIMIDKVAADALLEKLEEISNANDDLGMIIMCYEDGRSKPREITEITGFEKAKVNNLKKTLKRKLKMFDPSMEKRPFDERRGV